MGKKNKKQRRNKNLIRSSYSGKVVNGKEVIAVNEIKEYLSKIGYFFIDSVKNVIVSPKKNIMFFLLSLFLFSFVIAQTFNISEIDSKLSYGDFEVELFLDENTKVSANWIYNEETKEFFPETNLKGILFEIHFRVSQLESERTCITENQFYSECNFEKIDFSKFENKNNIERKEINYIQDGDYYLISFYGEIIDLDPAFIIGFSSSSQGFFNQTQATPLGINLTGTNTSGDFKYFVYYNSSSINWNTTLNHNSTIGLQTRTANNYNLTDSGLVSFWSFNDNQTFLNITDEKGLNNATNNGSLWNDSFGVVGAGYNFDETNYINIDDVVNDLSNTSEGTITAWINPVLGGNRGILSFGDTDANSYIIFLNNPTGNLVAELRNNGVVNWGLDLNNTSYLSNNNWYHVALIHNGSIARILVNGIEPQQEFYNSLNLSRWISGISGLDNARVSGWNHNNLGNVQMYDGSIDEVKIYNRSLSNAEVQNLYELGTQHILWNDFDNEGDLTSGVPITSNSQGNFFQYKANFTASGYLFNQSVIPLGVPNDTINPLISFTNGTEPDESTKLQDFIFINVSLEEDNLENMNYYLYNGYINKSSLVGYWNFDRNNITIYDYSGNNNHGTNNNTLFNESSIIGSTRNYNALNSSIILSSVLNNISSTTRGTISFWFRVDDAIPRTIIAFGDTSNQDFIQFRTLIGGILEIRVLRGGSNEWILRTNQSTFGVREWHHASLVKNENEAVFYFNGIEVPQFYLIETNKSIWFNDLTGIDNVRVGALETNFIQTYWEGQIDEVMIFNEAINSTQALSLSNRRIVNLSMFSSPNLQVNFTNLPYNNYHYYVDAVDTFRNFNVTEIRRINLVAPPFIRPNFPLFCFDVIMQNPKKNKFINIDRFLC